MFIEISKLIKQGDTVAVALSGGSDSMALLYYMLSEKQRLDFNLVAINVEHGIRGEESLSDTAFVKNQCQLLGVPLYCYSVDCIDYAAKNKLTVEQAARKLRYDCFFKAIENGLCDKVATAHHADDNLESVLFNLFRGTGISGLSGIKQNFEKKIIRPFLSVDKLEIDRFVKENDIPFVTDSTNLSDKYSRNFLRLNVIPKIKELFPDAQKSVARLSKIAAIDDEYLQEQAKKALVVTNGGAHIPLPQHAAVLSRAIILALKALGLEKDWENVHVQDVLALSENQNSKKITLPKGITAIVEYGKLVFFKERAATAGELPFSLGRMQLGDVCVEISTALSPVNLKSGLFCDGDKIPKDAVIRNKRDGDRFTKFGCGTKSIGDYLTDKKIPLRERDNLIVLASGSEILCIFGVAVSNKIKVDENTKSIIKFNLIKE